MVTYRDFKLIFTWIFEKDTYMYIIPIPILLALLHLVRGPIYRHLRTWEQWILIYSEKLPVFKIPPQIKIVYNHCFVKKISERNEIFDSLEQKQVAIKSLKRIGIELLLYNKTINETDYKSAWSEKRIKESALGYNDAQQLIVFDYNIPTYTLTALWGNGCIKGKQWKGLFVRKD